MNPWEKIPMSPEERARVVVAERETVFGRPGYVSRLDAISSAIRAAVEEATAPLRAELAVLRGEHAGQFVTRQHHDELIRAAVEQETQRCEKIAEGLAAEAQAQLSNPQVKGHAHTHYAGQRDGALLVAGRIRIRTQTEGVMETKHPWFVWESEYAEDGCTIISAATAAEAKDEYLRMTGADPETELDAKLVKAEDAVRLEAQWEQAQDSITALREKLNASRARADRSEAALREAHETLQGIATAHRFDRDVFDDDAAFADWAQSRARHEAGKIAPLLARPGGEEKEVDRG